MQTDSNVEKSRPFYNLLHRESLPDPGKRILGPPVCLPMPRPLTPWAEEAGRPPQEPLYGVSANRGGEQERRDEWTAGRQRLHKGPSVCPSCPHTDINKMCIYLFIYTSGLGQRLGARSVPEGPRHSTVCRCGQDLNQPRRWEKLPQWKAA